MQRKRFGQRWAWAAAMAFAGASLAAGDGPATNAPAWPQGGDARPARTATFVVAAADSPAHVKAQADAVCPGRDDHLVINAAIQALPEAGGRVHLAAGTYQVGAVTGTHGGITIRRSAVLLTGEGDGTRLRLQDGLTDINVIWIYGTLSNITVRDLCINGNASNQVPWVRARSGWDGGNGIKARNDRETFGRTPHRVRVEHCRIEDCQLMAVMLTGDTVEVLDCTFSGTFGSHVIELLGESGRIEGCTLRVGAGNSCGYGFSTDHSLYYHILNNKIFVDAGGVIRGHPINNWPPKRYSQIRATNLYHGVIAGNLVINNGQAGAVLIQGFMDLVHDNVFRGVPVVIEAMGLNFHHNTLIQSSLDINSPHRGDDCRLFFDGNLFFQSSVTRTNGVVVWGRNPGRPGESP